MLYFVTNRGYIDLLSEGVTQLLLVVACEYERQDLLPIIIRYYPKDICMWNDILQGACSAGNMDLVTTALYAGAKAYRRAFIAASSGGHRNILDLLLPKCSGPPWDIAFREACRNNHLQISRYCLNKKKVTQSGLDSGLAAACNGHAISCAEYCISKGAKVESGIIAATRSGNIRLVQTLLKTKDDVPEYQRFWLKRALGNVRLHDIHMDQLLQKKLHELQN